MEEDSVGNDFTHGAKSTDSIVVVTENNTCSMQDDDGLVDSHITQQLIESEAVQITITDSTEGALREKTISILNKFANDLEAPDVKDDPSNNIPAARTDPMTQPSCSTDQANHLHTQNSEVVTQTCFQCNAKINEVADGWKLIVNDKDDIISKKEVLIESLQRKMEARATENELYEERIKSLESTIDRMENKLADKFHLLQESEDNLREKNKEINLLQNKNKEFNGRVRTLESTHDELESKLRNITLILQKAEETVTAKSELLDAKNEIIEHLKAGTSVRVSESSTNTTDNLKNDQIGNDKHGVKECCEFLHIHASSGVAMNSMLVWADIQRHLHPDDHWKPLAVKGFLPTEITEAKELLWRSVDESIIGKIVKRQGSSKSISEVNDICNALKKLSEKDCVPMFLATSHMIAQTPIFSSVPIKNDSIDIISKLQTIEESINSINERFAAQLTKADNKKENSEDSGEESSSDDSIKETRYPNDISLGATISIGDIAPITSDDDDAGKWTKVTPRKSKGVRINPENPQWHKESLVAISSIVISGVAKNIGQEVIYDFLTQKNIEITDCELLTKNENANFLSYKLNVQSVDLQKVKNPNTWPKGISVKMYNDPKQKRGSNTSNASKTNRNKNKANAKPNNKLRSSSSLTPPSVNATSNHSNRFPNQKADVLNDYRNVASSEIQQALEMQLQNQSILGTYRNETTNDISHILPAHPQQHIPSLSQGNSYNQEFPRLDGHIPQNDGMYNRTTQMQNLHQTNSRNRDPLISSTSLPRRLYYPGQDYSRIVRNNDNVGLYNPAHSETNGYGSVSTQNPMQSATSDDIPFNSERRVRFLDRPRANAFSQTFLN